MTDSAISRFSAFYDGDMTFDQLVAWARTFPWKPIRHREPGDFTMESPDPWPQPDTTQEIEAAVADGVLTEDEADILFSAVDESS